MFIMNPVYFSVILLFRKNLFFKTSILYRKVKIILKACFVNSGYTVGTVYSIHTANIVS